MSVFRWILDRGEIMICPGGAYHGGKNVEEMYGDIMDNSDLLLSVC